LLYLSPILNIAPNTDRVDATGQLGEKSAKIGPFFLSLGSVHFSESYKVTHPPNPGVKTTFETTLGKALRALF
jgi:hypothetical protein